MNASAAEASYWLQRRQPVWAAALTYRYAAKAAVVHVRAIEDIGPDVAVHFDH